MAFPIRYNTKAPIFTPAPGIGTHSCDMSLVARIPKNSAAHGIITSIQRSAAAKLGEHAHILTEDQAHITLVNAVCIDIPPIPGPEEQNAIFKNFCSALSAGYIQNIFNEPADMVLDRFLVNQWDIKIGTENLAWGQKRKDIADYLIKELGDKFFLPADDHSLFHSTIFRFAQGFCQTDYGKVLEIVRNAKNEAEQNGPYTLTISSENTFAVKFPGRYLGWEMCVHLRY